MQTNKSPHLHTIIMVKRIGMLLLLLWILPSIGISQDQVYEEWKKTESAIPSAPAFAMLGVNPETVLRPSDLKSFKVDWRIKNYNLAPDLALEAQPLWHLYYKNLDYQAYLKTSALAKKLSTISLSFGTAKLDGVNHASYALKVNLYRHADLAGQKDKLKEMELAYYDQNRGLVNALDSLLFALPTLTDMEERRKVNQEIDSIRRELKRMNREMRTDLRTRLEEMHYDQWNRTMLDLAFGSVYTYNNGKQEGERIRHAGIAMWLNGSIRSGSQGLVTGIFRYTGLHRKSNIMMGTGYRHGNANFNFYGEVVYEFLGNYFDPEAEESFDPQEVFANDFAQDLGSSWLNFNNNESRSQYTVSVGGDFKLHRNILLNFALRTQFNDEGEMLRLLPVANVVCLMK